MSFKIDALIFACFAAAMTLPALGAPMHKAPIDTFHHWSAKELEDLAKTPQASNELSDHEFFWIETLTRDKSGEVELHDHWNDNIVIQAGEASFTYGGKMIGGKEVETGNWRGSSIEGGKTITLRAGDMLIVPAGLPHLFTLEKGKTVRYLVFKSRQ